MFPSNTYEEQVTPIIYKNMKPSDIDFLNDLTNNDLDTLDNMMNYLNFLNLVTDHMAYLLLILRSEKKLIAFLFKEKSLILMIVFLENMILYFFQKNFLLKIRII